MPAPDSDIQFDAREIDNFSLTTQTRFAQMDFATLLRGFRSFTQTLGPILKKAAAAILSVRRYHQPGDVKLSLRQYDETAGIDQMPGYVPWIPGLVLTKADYPALYEAIGSAATDGDNVTTFTLPDHQSGYIRVAAVGETPTSNEGEFQPYASGTSPRGIVLAAWIKT